MPLGARSTLQRVELLLTVGIAVLIFFQPVSASSQASEACGALDSDGDGIGDLCECGDFNGDGFVNTTDARLIQCCAVNQIPCGGLCDANDDGLCNTTDARIVQRLAVGQLEKSDLGCATRLVCGDGVVRGEEVCDGSDAAACAARPCCCAWMGSEADPRIARAL